MGSAEQKFQEFFGPIVSEYGPEIVASYLKALFKTKSDEELLSVFVALDDAEYLEVLKCHRAVMLRKKEIADAVLAGRESMIDWAIKFLVALLVAR